MLRWNQGSPNSSVCAEISTKEKEQTNILTLFLTRPPINVDLLNMFSKSLSLDILTWKSNFTLCNYEVAGGKTKTFLISGL